MEGKLRPRTWIKDYGYKGILGGDITFWNTIRATKFFCQGRISSLFLYVSHPEVNSTVATCAIYDTSLNLIAQTEEVTIPATFDGLLRCNFLTTLTLQYAYYWLAMWAQETPFWFITGATSNREPGDVDQTFNKSKIYTGNFPDPIVPSSYVDFKHTLYVSDVREAITGVLKAK